MQCAEIIALLPEYVRRRLPADQTATVRAHLSDCAECATAYEDELSFSTALRGTDMPAPAFLMTQVMANVRAEPRQVQTFRVRALDFVFAIAAAFTLGGLTLAVLSLRAISPVFANLFDPHTLLPDGLTSRTLTLAVLGAIVLLAVCIPIAAMMHSLIVRSRSTSLWSIKS